MASVNFVPYQDPENLLHRESEKKSGTSTRKVLSKTFGQDSLHYATPRKALGDVKNVTLQQSASAVKNPLKSVRKLSSSCYKNNKPNNNNIPENSVSRTYTAKGKQITKGKDEVKIRDHSRPATQLPAEFDRDEFLLSQEKEIMFPYKDEDPEFVMPEYLETVLHKNMIENLWWPSFTETLRTEEPKPVQDAGEAELEDLFLHEEIHDPLWMTLPDHFRDLELSSLQTEDLNFCSEDSLSLGELEKDLDEIDQLLSL